MWSMPSLHRCLAAIPRRSCLWRRALDDDLLLAIAAQHNLSETAYFEPQSEGTYRLRWFTPKAEVRLCGHATLATAWVIRTLEGIQSEGLRFETLSGTLTVKEAGSDALAIDFPAIETREIEPIPALEDALGVPVRSVRAAVQDPWQLIVSSMISALLNDAPPTSRRSKAPRHFVWLLRQLAMMRTLFRDFLLPTSVF